MVECGPDQGRSEVETAIVAAATTWMTTKREHRGGSKVIDPKSFSGTPFMDGHYLSDRHQRCQNENADRNSLNIKSESRFIAQNGSGVKNVPIP
jgi:hypothetical protein